jgi:AbrB family looped-hinge helix DNA binding protein
MRSTLSANLGCQHLSECYILTRRSNTVRITSKGQVTIPVEIRERLGLLPETEVEFRVEGSAVRIVKAAPSKGRSRGEAVVAGLRGRATVRMSTDEILALTRQRSGR